MAVSRGWPRGMHPSRQEFTAQLLAGDPVRDYEAMYRSAALFEFPLEMSIAFHMAYYRPFAAPRIAALLDHTGEIAANPRKRSYDTGLFMYELIEHGLAHPRSREVIRALNRMHRRWSIEDEDYRYVLATFVVVPARWIDRFGWRALTPVEREAMAAFYAEVGARLGVADPPRTFAEFSAVLDRYEARHVARSAAGVRLMGHTTTMFATRLPAPARPFTRLLTAALVDDARISDALALPRAGRLARAAMRGAWAARAVVVRRCPPRSESWFQPGVMATSQYPDGYRLSDLGLPAAGPETDPHGSRRRGTCRDPDG